MTLKSVVAVASGGTEDASVLTCAGKLAAHYGALVRVAPAFANPAADLVFYGAMLGQSLPPEAVERLAASGRDAQAALDALMRDVATREGLASHLHDFGPAIVLEPRELQPALALASAAALTDLVVFGSGAAGGALAPLFAETLLSMRAPCLLVKDERPLFGPAAIAWDGSAQAGRALRAALPLLQAAPAVFVLHNTDDDAGRWTEAEPARIQDYLARHGVSNVAMREARGGHVAASLLEAARGEGCALLVAGGYGRPRLMELALGGTTRVLVEAPEGPHVLLTH